MKISWVKLFWLLLWFSVFMVILSNYISWNLVRFIFCIIMMMLILFSVYKEIKSEKTWIEFDEIIMKSNDIENTLLELYNFNKYKEHIYEYKENQKYIKENDKEIIIYNKNNIFLIKITKKGIEYKDFFKSKVLSYDNIICVCDSTVSIWKWSLTWIIINTKDSENWKKTKLFNNIFSWKKIFIPWENWKTLPIRRKFLIYKINKFIEKNNIKLAS